MAGSWSDLCVWITANIFKMNVNKLAGESLSSEVKLEWNKLQTGFRSGKLAPRWAYILKQGVFYSLTWVICFAVVLVMRTTCMKLEGVLQQAQRLALVARADISAYLPTCTGNQQSQQPPKNILLPEVWRVWLAPASLSAGGASWVVKWISAPRWAAGAQRVWCVGRKGLCKQCERGGMVSCLRNNGHGCCRLQRSLRVDMICSGTAGATQVKYPF